MDPKFVVTLNGKKRRNRPETMDRKARFLSKVARTKDPWDCWVWTAGRHPTGYGKFSAKGSTDRYAHRWSYRFHTGEIPVGKEIDHLCRNRACVNPVHLEAVSHAENSQRGETGRATGARQRAKTQCANGHVFDAANTYVNPNGERACRACMRDHSAAYHHRHIEAVAEKRREKYHQDPDRFREYARQYRLRKKEARLGS